MKVLALLLNCVLVVIMVPLFYYERSDNEVLVVTAAGISCAIVNLWVLIFGKDPSWLGLYFKRRRLECTGSA